MAQVNGYNPLRWDCSKRGCFNKLKRPKIEVFYDCFPGKINFGDVDAMVEINGRGLLVEWKEGMQELKFGQRTMFSRLSKTELLTWFVVSGDAATMDVDGIMTWFGGKSNGWKPCTIDVLKERIRSWVAWAQKQRT